MWALVGIGERPAPRYSARALTAFIPRGLILSPATEQRRTHSSEGKFHRIKSSGKTYRFVSTHPPAQQGQDALGSVLQPWPLPFFTAGEILHRSSPGPRLLSQLVPVNFRRKARSVASVGPVPTDRPSSTARQTVGLHLALGRSWSTRREHRPELCMYIMYMYARAKANGSCAYEFLEVIRD